MPASQPVRVACESLPLLNTNNVSDDPAEPIAASPAPSSLQARLAAMRAHEAGATDVTPIYHPPANAGLRPPTAVALNQLAEADLLAILTAPLLPGESALCGHQRKEHQLGTIFATLSVGEARTLHQRFSRPSTAADALTSKFAGLIIDRRQRLLAFIADARRRAAIAQSRTR